jgi:hypothetical protein
VRPVHVPPAPVVSAAEPSCLSRAKRRAGAFVEALLPFAFVGAHQRVRPVHVPPALVAGRADGSLLSVSSLYPESEILTPACPESAAADEGSLLSVSSLYPESEILTHACPEGAAEGPAGGAPDPSGFLPGAQLVPSAAEGSEAEPCLA